MEFFLAEVKFSVSDQNKPWAIYICIVIFDLESKNVFEKSMPL